MAVKIRLTRTGKKKQPSYRVVVMDSRKPRDGKYIEQIGRYDARQEPSLIEIDNERALVWLHQGAQPTERAQKLLEISGAWAQFRVDRGEIHTVGDHEPTAYPEKSVAVDAEAEEATSDQLPVASDEGSEEPAAEGTGEALAEAAPSTDEVSAEAADEAVEETAEEVAGVEDTAEALADAAEGTDEQEDSA
jgi:small subunit ribosomal protein S16